MKTWKRNAIVATVLLFVCAGIYLNWMYGEDSAKELTDTLDREKVMDDAALVIQTQEDSLEALAGTQDAMTTQADYFAKMRLSRQESRDSAVELLQETISYAGEGESTAEPAAQLDKLVSRALKEAQIESLIIAKGYEDCVAYMTDDGISVAVASQEGGLKESDVALLSDVITTQSEFSLPQIRIIEVGENN